MWKKSFNFKLLKLRNKTAKIAAIKKRPKARLNGGIVSRFAFIKGKVAPQINAVVVSAIIPVFEDFMLSKVFFEVFNFSCF